MKRKIYLTITACLISLFFVSTATAQLHFGLQSGVVFSKASMVITKNGLNVYEYVYQKPPKLIYVITNATNLYFSYTFSPTIAMAVEPGYIQMSNEYNGGLTYIQLPVLAEYKVIDKLHLTAGPELNFLLNNDSQNRYKGLDLAVQLGTYYKVSGNFDLGFKYSRSLSKFLKHDIVRFGEDINFRHNNFQFYTRYKF